MDRQYGISRYTTRLVNDNKEGNSALELYAAQNGVIYRVPFPLLAPWATWSMGTQRLEEHLNTLRVGSGGEPS